jgi:2OG-Fe(II) oxygenase superfamily
MKIKVIEDFVTPEDAQALINQLNNPDKGIYPDYYKDRNGGTAFPYNQETISLLKKYGHMSNKVQEEFFKTQSPVIITKSFGSSWQKGGKGAPHIDAVEKEPFIEYSSVLYLNDEYEGGEIYFPMQKFLLKPKKYSAIFFPGNDMDYLHGVSEIMSGNRYTALWMQSTKVEFADPDYL